MEKTVQPDDANILDAGFPWQTSLILKPDRVAELVEFCIQRVDDLKAEMGRGNRGGCTGWMGLRERSEYQSESEYEWRRESYKGVFAGPNYSLNTVKRNSKNLTAKINKELFGTDPYFMALPEGVDNKEFSEKIGRASDWKARQFNLKRPQREATKLAIDLGERVVRVIHHVNRQPYKDFENVLVDPETGEMVMTKTGRYVTEKDWMIDLMVMRDTEEDQEARPRRINLNDMTMVEPENPVYQRRLVDKAHIVYSGPIARGVHFRDFLCPLTAESVHSADFICEIQEMPIHRAALEYGRPDLTDPKAQKKGGKFWEIYKTAINILRAQTHDSPKSAEAEPNFLHGEGLRETHKAGADPSIQILNCYFRADVHRDGVAREVVFILALPEEGSKEAEVLYYNYTGSCFPRGRRPYEVVPRRRVPGRWYGEGVFEEYFDQDLFIDYQLNRVVYRSSINKNVTVVDMSLVEEENDPFDLSGTKKTYHAKPDANTENFIRQFNLFERVEEAEALMQTMVQSIQLEIGAMSEADSSFAGLPSSDTATGANINAGITETLVGEEANEIADGQNDVLRAFVRCYLYGIAVNNQTEFFQYSQGRDQKIDMISKGDVENLDVNVRLLLTRRQNRTLYERSTEGTQLINEFLDTLMKSRQMGIPDEAIMPGMRELFIQRANALELDDTETIFPDLTNLGGVPGTEGEEGEGGAPMPGGQPQPTAELEPVP